MGCEESKQAHTVQQKVDINSLLTPRADPANLNLKCDPAQAQPQIEQKQEKAAASTAPPIQEMKGKTEVKQNEVQQTPVKTPPPPQTQEPHQQQSASRDRSSSLQQAQMGMKDSPQPAAAEAERQDSKVKPNVQKDTEIIEQRVNSANVAVYEALPTGKQVTVDKVSSLAAKPEEEKGASGSESQEKGEGEELDDVNDRKEVKFDMVPKVESLIEYQEVMESTPEDVATPEQRQQYDARQKSSCSMESSEPLVADERDAYDDMSPEQNHENLAQHEHGQKIFDNVPVTALVYQSQIDLMPASYEKKDEIVVNDLSASGSAVDSLQSVVPMVELVTSDITEQLKRSGLGEVILSSNSDGKALLDDDYYLRVLNQSVRIAEEYLSEYLTQAIQRRRAAFKSGDFVVYEAIVVEMQARKENKSTEVQEKVCEALGVTSAQFNETGNAMLQGDRSDDVTMASQGQLIGDQQEGEEIDEEILLTEDQTLEIFDMMLRSQSEQQTLLQKSAAENASEEDLSTLLVVHDSKNMDQIHVQYNVELKQFHSAVKHYAETNASFTDKLNQLEEEIMDCSV